MSFPHSVTPDLLEEKLESLGTQHEFLNLLRLRHLHWMTSAADPRVKQYHQEIAELLEQVTARYTRLLAELEPPASR